MSEMRILKFVHYNNIRKHFLPNRVSEVRRPSIACQKITLAISTCFDAALLYFARAFQFLIIHCQIQGVPFKKETKISASPCNICVILTISYFHKYFTRETA